MADWLNIAGRTVVVTGASSGIGKAIVEELLLQNTFVINLIISAVLSETFIITVCDSMALNT